jgi:DNA-binding beta-propeller fold protein YncE
MIISQMKKNLFLTLAPSLLLLMLSAPCLADEALELINTETIPAGSGVKSVIISPDGSKVYSANLEGMSVYEFERNTRTIIRKLAFAPTPGKGYNYTTKEEIDSYEEKPVEQHITHNGRYLWVSLHNAGGVVVWDLENGDTAVEGRPFKEATIRYKDGSKPKQHAKLLLLKTGKTPKVITSSPDGSYLFVANWHSNTVSIIDISTPEPSRWKKISDIKARIPRGLIVSEDSKTLYIAEMGAEDIMVIDLDKMKKIDNIHVGLNPRHLVLNHGSLFVSLNLGSHLARVDLDNKVMAQAETCYLPRTIGIPRNSGAVFSVCYKGDKLQAFSSDDMRLIGEWDAGPRPVGLDVYSSDEDENTFEVWVANYTAGTLTVYTFKKSTGDIHVQAAADPIPQNLLQQTSR